MPELQAHLIRNQNRRSSLHNGSASKPSATQPIDIAQAVKNAAAAAQQIVASGNSNRIPPPANKSTRYLSEISGGSEDVQAVKDARAAGEFIPSTPVRTVMRKLTRDNLAEGTSKPKLADRTQTFQDYSAWLERQAEQDAATQQSLKEDKEKASRLSSESEQTPDSSVSRISSKTRNKLGDILKHVRDGMKGRDEVEWGGTHSLRITPEMQENVFHLTKEQEIEYKWFFRDSSTFRHIWDLVGLALVLYEVFFLPYAWTFGSSVRGSAESEAFGIFIDVFFITDIFVSLLTSFEDNDTFMEVKGPPSHLAVHYLMSWKWVLDVLSAIPWSRIGRDDNSEALQLLKMVRFVRVVKIGQKFFTKFRHSAKAGNAAFTLLLLLLSFAVVVHSLCCAHYVVFGELYEDYNDFMKYTSVLTTVLANMFAAGIITGI